MVKPYRGVASDGVFLCRDKQAAKESFDALFGQPQFGGGMNEAVLIQVSYNRFIAVTSHSLYSVCNDS